MKSLVKLAAISAFAVTAFMPLYATAEIIDIDPTTTSSVKKPVKTNGNLYPENALQGLFF